MRRGVGLAWAALLLAAIGCTPSPMQRGTQPTTDPDPVMGTPIPAYYPGVHGSPGTTTAVASQPTPRPGGSAIPETAVSPFPVDYITPHAVVQAPGGHLWVGGEQDGKGTLVELDAGYQRLHLWNLPDTPRAMLADGNGTIWAAFSPGNSGAYVTMFGPDGAPLRSLAQVVSGPTAGYGVLPHFYQDPRGPVWWVGDDAHQLSAAGGTLQLLPSRNRDLTDVAVDAAGRSWVAGSFPLTDTTDSQLTELTPDGQATATPDVGSFGHGPVWVGTDDRGRLWAAAAVAAYDASKPRQPLGLVLIFDANGQEVGSFDLPDVPVALSPGAGGHMWLQSTDPRDGHLRLTDYADQGKPGARYKLGSFGADDRGSFGPGGFWYGSARDNALYHVPVGAPSPAASLAPGGTIRTLTGQPATAVAAARDGSAWLAGPGPTATHVDATGATLGSVQLPGTCEALDVDPADGSLWAAVNATGLALVHVAADGQASPAVPLPVGAAGITYVSRRLQAGAAGVVWCNGGNRLAVLPPGASVPLLWQVEALGSITACAAAADGHLWVGGEPAGSGGPVLVELGPDGRAIATHAAANAPGTPSALGFDDQGRLWLFTARYLTAVDRGISNYRCYGAVYGPGFQEQAHFGAPFWVTQVRAAGHGHVWAGLSTFANSLYVGASIAELGADGLALRSFPVGENGADGFALAGDGALWSAQSARTAGVLRIQPD